MKSPRLILLEMSNASPPNPFASISLHLSIVMRTSRMRVILCPHEIGRNTRQDNEATAELSHGGSSTASVLPWIGSACNTYACSHAHDAQPEEIQGDPFARPLRKRRQDEARGDSCANGPLRVANGTLASAPWDARAAREKRVRKKMIGQDLRYKKRFVPLAPVRPYDILSPRAKNARRSRARGSRGFLQLAPSRITDEKDSILLPWTNKLQRTCVHARCLWPAPHPLPLSSIHVGPRSPPLIGLSTIMSPRLRDFYIRVFFFFYWADSHPPLRWVICISYAIILS